MTAPSWITPAGVIGSVSEGTIFNFSLDFMGSPTPTVNFLAGFLPPGLSLSPSGVISGEAQLEIDTTNFEFAVRLTNSDGFSDRTFNIVVQNQPPIWADPNNLGTFPPETDIEYSFFVTDPGGFSQTFEKISGTLPPGIALNSFGKLYGVLEGALPLTTYTFTIRAILNATQHLDKTFTITVDPLALAPPTWLTPAGLLGDAEVSIPTSFQVVAASPDFLTVTYSAIGLPANLSIDPSTGIISGTLISPVSTTYSFSAIATSGASNSSRIFSINANKVTTSSVSWITPFGSLGQIKEGDKSLLSLEAESAGSWVRYELTGGSLPLGLSIDVNTGNIVGLAQKQITANTVFNFQVTAYTDVTETIGNFSIELIVNYDPGATRVYATVYGNAKLVFIDLFTTQEVLIGDIFRDGDPQFGFLNKPRILLAENLNNPGAPLIADTMYGTRRTYLNFGKVLVGQAVVNNEVVYEVLYRKIYDDYAGTPEQYTFTVEKAGGGTADIATLRPGSLGNIRSQLLALGSSAGRDNLPLWMQSEQTIGVPSTVPGWVPCLEFAYVLPGTGQKIADKINANDVQLKKLYNNRVRIDRFVMENAADNPGSQWPTKIAPAATYFEPQYILFDNKF